MAVGKTETSVAVALRFGNNAMLYIRVLRLPLTPAGGFTKYVARCGSECQEPAFKHYLYLI
jgi:hypothetical protein